LAFDACAFCFKGGAKIQVFFYAPNFSSSFFAFFFSKICYPLKNRDFDRVFFFNKHLFVRF
ncbi:MAG: hypothetical protein JW735_00645, partial [Prolixibacteraceae bacterium]|nr:hypothetical protein [Prolixibacteraceae bacterium]